MHRRSASLFLPLLLSLPLLTPPREASAQAAPAGQKWVATWGTAQELYRRETPPGEAQAARPGQQGPITVQDQTVRMVVRTSAGGSTARLRLSSSFGAPTVVLGAARVALRASGSATVPGSARLVRFGGDSTVVLHPGVVVLSDPIDFDVPAFGDLVVSLHMQGDAGRPTAHPLGLHTTYISQPGNHSADVDFEAARTSQSYYWLGGVDVLAPDDDAAFTIVALGNSITDGARSTPDTDRMWPARLAARLAANPATRHVGVVNAGISGNRVLSDGAGMNVLTRLEHDVLSYPAVKWVILMEGINDIGALTRGATNPVVTADRLIWAYRQVVARAHAQGVKVAGATLTPYEGAGYYSAEGEQIRQAVNNWIRTSGEVDAVIDFDAVTRDPANPGRFLPAYDPGDHLHPNDAGYQAMADAIDLSIFERN